MADRHAVGGLGRGDQSVETAQILNRLDLWQDDRVKIGRDRVRDVLFAETGLERIYANAAQETAQTRESGSHAGARGRLLPRRDSVLEVETPASAPESESFATLRGSFAGQNSRLLITISASCAVGMQPLYLLRIGTLSAPVSRLQAAAM